jgi:hypothetical protein
MKLPRFSRFVACIATATLASSFVSAQLSPQQVAATNKILQQMQATIGKLSPQKQQMLDGYANINQLATAWSKYGMRMTDPTFVARAKAVSQSSTAPGVAGIVPVSNPTTDVAYSSFGGFTQSETSTARCGNTVVVGFNDSGSVFETPYYFTGTGGESFSGSGYSTNGGASFTDIGPINPGTNTYNFLGGDPMVNCTDPNTFYFTQIFDFYDSSFNPWAAIAINASTNGGKSWGPPAAAIAKSAYYHVLDKPWSTIDPSNHSHILVSYTDFDYTYSSPYCGANARTAIEFVESFDGGVTWSSTPNIAIQVCGSAGVQGSQMAVSSTGTTYISWVNLGADFPLGPRVIQVVPYSGGVLGTTVNVDSSVQPGGDSYYLQGEFRDFLDMAMAIDHSGTSSDGTLYITWADGRDKIVPDPLGIQGAYAYDDVFLRQSFDGGNTWGFAPIKVNSDIQPRLGSGRDHFQSGVAVDSRGYVGVCWYDRRSDVENFAIRRHCAESTNDGYNWTDSDIGLSPFAPTHGGDLFINSIYMGDYDQLSSDFLNENPGFVGAFENQGTRGNPDVDAHSFK